MLQFCFCNTQQIQ